MQIVRALEPQQLVTAEALIREYKTSVGLGCCGQQEFEAEFSDYPAPYAHPSGAILLAGGDVRAVGCVALKDSGDSACEMKRLYVKPEARGRGVGRALVAAAIEEARALGYRRIRLDTTPEMVSAVALYRSMGFRAADAFRESHSPNPLFFELDLP